MKGYKLDPLLKAYESTSQQSDLSRSGVHGGNRKRGNLGKVAKIENAERRKSVDAQ